MANTDLLIPIVVAVIGLLGSALSLFLSWRTERRTHRQEVANLTRKYAQPLLAAAYDLAQRLYELVEYPISRQHLTTKEGVEDLKLYTCYLLAQYLAFAHILRTQTGYLSFTEDPKMKKLRTVMYKIDEELDRRRDPDLWNVGVWPAARILVSERMVVKTETADDAKTEKADKTLDGGLGVEVKGFDKFSDEWDKSFKQPMGYFCEWIDMMLEGRLDREKPYSDSPIRCLQHLLIDLVVTLDRNRKYILQDASVIRCAKSTRGCDCSTCEPKKDFLAVWKERQDSRRGDYGLWPRDGLKREDKRKLPHCKWDYTTSLEDVQKMTQTINLA